jgi:hydroxyacylglutathione hydrolase
MKDDPSLQVRRFVCGLLETNCYVLIDRGKASCLLVDPGEAGGPLERFLDEERLTVDRILLTHGHIDHIAGVSEFRSRRSAPVWIHPSDAEMLTRPESNLSVFLGPEFRTEPADGFLEDGAVIPFRTPDGLRVIHTPGHTPGGVCFSGPGFVITGDTLFRGSIGRTDFPGSSERLLLQSIHRGLLVLADDVRVFPGHGEPTHIGHERKYNPFLSGRLG